jgi:hypothetical protein
MTWQHIPLLPPKEKKLPKKEKRKETVNKFFEEIVSDAIEVDIDDLEKDCEGDIEPEIEQIINITVNKKVTVKSDHIRVNFPPFWHYRLNEANEPYVVGKSHWVGDLETGQFSKSHGSLTNNLALMIIKLSENYALKSNWRNYTFRDEMEGQAILQLCQVVLQFDESKSSNPFSFLTQISYHSFVRMFNSEKKNRDIRDELLIRANKNPSYSRTNSDTNFGDE